MATAKLLRNVSVFFDGVGYAGKFDSFDPPKLSLNTEAFRPGGTDMPQEIDMGMEKMECKLATSNADIEALKRFGLANGADTALTLRGAQKGRGTAVEAVEHHCRGLVKEVDWGTWEPGKKAPCSFMVTLSYYKCVIGGEVTAEIDVENMKRIIDGVDQLAALREALGL